MAVKGAGKYQNELEEVHQESRMIWMCFSHYMGLRVILEVCWETET